MALKSWDLNNNGIPDHREPIFAKLAWGLFSTLVQTFAKPHTIIRRAVDAVDPKVREAWDHTRKPGEGA